MFTPCLGTLLSSTDFPFYQTVISFPVEKTDPYAFGEVRVFLFQALLFVTLIMVYTYRRRLYPNYYPSCSLRLGGFFPA